MIRVENCLSKKPEHESEFAILYKSSGRTLAQSKEEKRRQFLQQQKEKRSSAFDEKRTLIELFPKVSRKNPFKYKLMYADWLTDLPDDLETNWIFKMCPQNSVRLLVVAHRAITTCYYPNGRICFKFKSNLPGGSSDMTPHKFTVLDCEYCAELKTFYIFDALAWNSMSLIDAEAQVRFFWLQSKFEENSDTVNSGRNKFIVMDFKPAERSLIQNAFFDPFMVNDHKIPYRGIIFFHKEGHYAFRHSPLVGWLKSFMVSEILHIDVDPFHLQDKPDDYLGVEDYITKINEKKQNKRKSSKNKLCEVEMEELEDGTSMEQEEIINSE